MPITGALCAVVLLREPFTLAHGVVLALGLGGIALAEWSVARGLRSEAARLASVRAPLVEPGPTFRPPPRGASSL